MPPPSSAIGTHVGRTVKPRAQIPRAQVSMRTALTVTAQRRGDAPPDPGGSPGLYRCAYVLGLPGGDGPAADIDVDAFLGSGRSLLLFPPQLQTLDFELTIQGRKYNIALRKNVHGEAAALTAEAQADSMLEAEALFYDNILPLVSWLSCRFEVALTVPGWVLTEVRTSTKKARVWLLGTTRELALPLPATTMTPEMRALFAAYREGGVVGNVFYQALSYWKVIEGVYFLRDTAAKAAIAEGQPAPVFARERVPETIDDIPYVDSWAAQGFMPYLGKRFTSVRDDLSKKLRDAVAHLVPGSTTLRSLSGDTFNDVSTCEEAVPVLRYMARTLITNYLTWQGVDW